jgi:hypothetical protein
MVAAEKGEAGGRFVFGAVGEPGFRPDSVEAQRGVPREGAEADNASPGGEQLELTTGVGETGVALGRSRFVLGWSTADGGGDPEPEQAQTVAGMLRDGHARKARAVERAEEEVARAVAGEETAGAVGSVGGWSQTEDDHFGFRVPKPRNRTAPVLLAGVSSLFVAGDLFSPLDESRAAPAGGYLLFERCEAFFNETFYVSGWPAQAP